MNFSKNILKIKHQKRTDFINNAKYFFVKKLLKVLLLSNLMKKCNVQNFFYAPKSYIVLQNQNKVFPIIRTIVSLYENI